MITDLAPFIVFLHGLSGSGKGVMQRELSEQCKAHGYDMHYASSGDLFRAAGEDPTILKRMREGGFIDTLGAIMPTLETTFERFIDAWFESSGRALLVLDGVVRKDAFVNTEGERIPSQIHQISVGMYGALSRVLQGAHADAAHVVFGSIAKSEAESSIVQCEDLICAAVQLLLDVRPEDAERQMQQRALKELQHLREQLNSGKALAALPIKDQNRPTEVVAALGELIRGNLVEHDEDEEVFFSATEADGTMPDFVARRIDADVSRERDKLAATAKLSSEESFAELFKAIGIETNLRDDDVSPTGRSGRIQKFISVETGPRGPIYVAGEAAKALLNRLCFSWKPDGSFASTDGNCIVIPNGASKGIDLEGLRHACSQHATTIIEQADRSRLALWEH